MTLEQILAYIVEIAPSIVAVCTVIATGVCTIRKIVASSDQEVATLKAENRKLREEIRASISASNDLKEEVRRLEKTISRVED